MATSTKNATTQTGGKGKYVKRNKEYWDGLKVKENKNDEDFFHRPAKDLQTKIKSAAKKDSGTSDFQPFEIETAPPEYKRNSELDVTLKRIEATVRRLLPGQAFIVPSKSKHSIKKYLQQNWPYCQFMYTIIKDNMAMMRVYFIKRLDKK